VGCLRAFRVSARVRTRGKEHALPTRSRKPIVLTTRFEEDEAGTLRHVPFDVPTGTNQLRISVSYNDRIDSNPTINGGNTLDIGLFDPQGIEAGGSGFRGWSGSNKLEIVIGTKWSTPPYRAGKPQTGTWNLLFGAYKVGPNGLDVEATIDLNPGIDVPKAPAMPKIDDLEQRELPKPAERHWYRGDLHAHTIYSDGTGTPAELAAAVYEAGLDFYGITDHNRAQSPVELVPSGKGWPVLVPGVEVTTYAGHFNVWGTDTWYDFRDYSPEGLQKAIDAAAADGGLVSMNHPKPFGPDWAYPELTGFHAMEPWNGWWDRVNNVALDRWDQAMRRGQKLTGVCGSDVHDLNGIGTPANPLSPARLGWPTLWVNTRRPLSAKAILDAIRKGECFMSDSPEGPQLYIGRENDAITVRIVRGKGTALCLVGNAGIIATEAITDDDQSWSFAINVLGKGQTYVRAELLAANGGIRALSNPVWL
jgi:hypothetical protein